MGSFDEKIMRTKPWGMDLTKKQPKISKWQDEKKKKLNEALIIYTRVNRGCSFALIFAQKFNVVLQKIIFMIMMYP